MNDITFLPFKLQPADIKQLANTAFVEDFPPISSLTSFNVLAKKSLNNDSDRIQAQKAQKHTEEYAEKPLLSYPKNANFAASIKTFT